jgi:hypothetical protein
MDQKRILSAWSSLLGTYYAFAGLVDYGSSHQDRPTSTKHER